MTYQISVPAQGLAGHCTIDLPASKSLSNRALIMQALCQEPCQLTHLSDCDDTVVMQRAFSTIAQQQREAGPVTIDIGAAGTSMRFLTAYFATRQGADVVMTGTERMKQRPIRILVDALRTLGADITYEGTEGCPPLRIHGKQLAGGPLSIDGSTSSQYISALLMVAPTLAKGLQLTLLGDVTSRPYILMTLGMMREFGIQSEWHDNVISIAPQPYQAQRYEVESDWSAASYWYEVLALAQACGTATPVIHLQGLHPDSLQGDSQVTRYFEPLGIVTEFTPQGVTLTAHPGHGMPQHLEWDMTEQPDLAQTVITTYATLGIGFDISGLHTLRIKETDRIAALENELSKLGHTVTDRDNDRMLYDGTAPNLAASATDTLPAVATYKDHRMAMAFAPVALRQALCIQDPGVVTKSYPQYWDHLRQIGFEVVATDPA